MADDRQGTVVPGGTPDSRGILDRLLALPAHIGRSVISFPGRFAVLGSAVPELWIVFVIKLFGILAYSVMNTTLVLWLSSNLNYSDTDAGFIITAWSTVMTLATVMIGSLTDAIGLRRAFMLGVVLCLFARTVMTLVTVPWIVLALGLFPLALGEALGTPIMVAAIHRYSTTAQRSIAFSIFYAVMNVGFLISYWIFDRIRNDFGESGHWVLPVVDVELSTYRILFLISLAFECVLVPVIYFGLREGLQVSEEGVKVIPEKSKYPGRDMWSALYLSVRDALRETLRIFVGLWGQPGFHKFLAFLTLAVFVRFIFFQMSYTYPKFGIRELGEGAPIATLWSLNAGLIIVLVPIVGAFSQRITAYRMVVYGSIIATASVFIMTLPLRWFQPLADGRLGHFIANSWLDGDEKFTVDDIRDLPAFVRKLNEPADPVSVTVRDSLSPQTKLLLTRELSPTGFRNAAPYSYPGSGLFSEGDIKDGGGFAARLRSDPNAATQPISKYVWAQMSSKEQEALAGAAALSQDEQKLMLKVLNRLLQDSALGKDDRFARVSLSDATQSLLKIDKKDRKARRITQSVVQNRLLLEDAYPEHVARSSHAVRVALADDLTKLIREKTIYDTDRFAGVALTGPVKAWLATGTAEKGAKAPAQINRYLVEDAYPNEIARNRIGVSGSVNPYYVAIVLFVILLSVGEAFFSPRLYEYAAAIAPKGQEASYMSMSLLPFFLAKLFVGMFSGILLEAYCPETGPRNSDTLWLIIALTTMISPAGLLLFGRYIRVKEAGRE
ncbi:MAG: MFS transporter [Phycisphaerae bacterium]|nr:MFS transporter [Phycisphaerae bacterium]